MSQKQKIKSVEIQKTATPFKKRSDLLQINPLLTEAIVVGFISSELFQLTLFIMRYHRTTYFEVPSFKCCDPSVSDMDSSESRPVKLKSFTRRDRTRDKS